MVEAPQGKPRPRCWARRGEETVTPGGTQYDSSAICVSPSCPLVAARQRIGFPYPVSGEAWGLVKTTTYPGQPSQENALISGRQHVDEAVAEVSADCLSLQDSR